MSQRGEEREHHRAATQRRKSSMATLLSAVAVLLSASCSTAFVSPTGAAAVRWSTVRARHYATSTFAAQPGRHRSRGATCFMATEELERIVDFITARKGEVVDAAEGIVNYEFDIVAPGSMTERLNHRITRLVKEKANYPGFMKGEIPRHVRPEVDKFVVEELVNQTIVMALEAYGLVGAEGEGTEAKVLSDMEDMLKIFKPGKELSFMCSIHAKPNTEGGEEEMTTTGGVIDVEASDA